MIFKFYRMFFITNTTFSYSENMCVKNKRVKVRKRKKRTHTYEVDHPKDL